MNAGAYSEEDTRRPGPSNCSRRSSCRSQGDFRKDNVTNFYLKRRNAGLAGSNLR